MKSLEDLRIQPRSEWQRKLRDHEVINVYCPGDEMAELEFGRCLRHYGIQTMIAVGIWFENRLFGFITLIRRASQVQKIDDTQSGVRRVYHPILLEHKEYIVEIFRNEYLNGLLVNTSDPFSVCPGRDTWKVNYRGSELFHPRTSNDPRCGRSAWRARSRAGCNRSGRRSPTEAVRKSGRTIVRSTWVGGAVFDAGPETALYRLHDDNGSIEAFIRSFYTGVSLKRHRFVLYYKILSK